MSAYRGVYETSWGGRWWASIKADGRYTYLGTFPDEKSAAQAYDQAALSLHGDRAKLNFPDEGGGEGRRITGSDGPGLTGLSTSPSAPLPGVEDSGD